MRSVPFSGRLKLSEDAVKFYESHGKVPGGYTRLLEQSLEYYVKQGALSNTEDLKAIIEKLNNNDHHLEEIKRMLKFVASSSDTFPPELNADISEPERG